ncbi:MAG: Do family serine endopeptidase [Nibricoccus sp.]
MNAARCLRFTAAAAAFFVSLAATSHAAEPKPAAPVVKKPQFVVDETPVTAGKTPALVSYADVIEPVQKAVVSVTSSKTYYRRSMAPFPWMPAPDRERKEIGIGSGVIVTADGYILTNNHVVEGVEELTVTLNDSREFKARVIGADPKTDVAVIKIEAESLPVATLADSDKLRVGDIVFAIGNPLEVGQTVTMGIVSATGRRVGILDEVQGYENFIQTDAAINQGNSGGALLDAKGRLIGINSAILSPTRANIGIGFAIPVNLARSIMEGLVETGKVTRGFLGVKVDPLSADLAETLQLKKDLKGVVVSVVAPGGPAEKAGIKVYDVITAINGRPVVSWEDLRLIVAQLAPNSEASVDLYREGKQRTIKAQLGELSDALARDELLTGVQVTRLNPAQRRQLGIDARFDGLMITDISEDSPHAEKLLPDMLILQINRQPVGDIENARALFVPGRNLLMVYYHGVIRPLTVSVK